MLIETLFYATIAWYGKANNTVENFDTRGASVVQQYTEHNTQAYLINLTRSIYKKITLNAGQANLPPLHVIDDETVNAWTDGYTVTMTTGLLKFIGNNPDEIAMVLGHELAHAMLGHLTFSKELTTVLKEADADKFGAYLMLRAGYDVCEGRKLMLQFRDAWGDDPSQDHPDNSYRYNTLSMPWCQKEG